MVAAITSSYWVAAYVTSANTFGATYLQIEPGEPFPVSASFFRYASDVVAERHRGGLLLALTPTAEPVPGVPAS